MAQRERLESIRQILEQEKRLTVSDMSKAFGVTEETIRRDFEKLENKGILTRVHGGAILNSERVTENIDYLMRERHNSREKQIIGRLAASVIPDQAVIGADASTTVMEAIRLLKNRSGITVLTNSVQIIREMGQAAFNVVSTGGVVNKSTSSMQGKIVRTVLSDYFVDVILIGCKALTLDGIFDSNEEEGEIKKMLVERGQKVILMADHTKFDRVAFVKVLDLKNLDMLITDREPSQAWKDLCRQKNVRLIYPE